MNKLAIDVAILPPEEIINICIQINEKDPEVFSKFSKTDNFPHVTLAMGVIDEDDFGKVIKIIQKTLKNFQPLELEIIKLHHEITPENKKSLHFVISPTEELKKLHQEIMNNLLPVLSYEVELDMFFQKSGEKINEVSKFWVENYVKKYSGSNYYPHISLKCRNSEYNNLPITFSASKIVLCQLGDYCTCRKILKEFNL